MLCASRFVLSAQNHIFWSKLAALCSCFVLYAWPCTTERPDFVSTSSGLLLLAICSVHMLCAYRAVTKKPDKQKA
jgi:hypothetical protein